MITIALDEQGEFEIEENDSGPKFIAGVIYNDKGDKSDYENERIRIKEYYLKVCEAVECAYPEDLHYYVKNNKNNAYSVKKVKTEVSKSLSEFLKNGTYKNTQVYDKERRGEYTVFAIMASERRLENLLGDNVSELVRDDYASNLYVHMAEKMVERLIFHNPVIEKIDCINLNLATRKAVLNNESKIADEYETIGFSEFDKNTSTNKMYNLTNTDLYRTVIEREMIDTGKTDIKINKIWVTPIKYKLNAKDMEFLYLSDSICSYLGFGIKGNKSEEWIEEVGNKISEISTANGLLFAYDSVDVFFEKSWKKIEDKDYYEAISILYDGINLKSSMSNYYNENVFKYIKEALLKEKCSTEYTIAIRKFSESIKNNNLNQDKLLFVFEILYRMKDNISYQNKEEGAILYDLNDAGVSVYCHIGDSKTAYRFYEECKKYSTYVAIEKYLSTRNKMVVCLCDEFKYEEALEFAKENLKYHRVIESMKKEMFGIDGEKEFKVMGIALSQLGQVYAMLCDGNAEGVFLEALSEFHEETPNYYITMSYLLHYYVDNNMKEKYEKMAKKYFGNNADIEKQLEYLLKEGSKETGAIFALKFAFYLYIKALYKFYLKDISKEFAVKILDVDSLFAYYGDNASKQINGHPWEIIYKYLAFIAYDLKEYNKCENLMKKTDNVVVNYGKIIDLIIKNGWREYCILVKDEDKCKKITDEINNMLTKGVTIEKCITYMYD